MLVVASTAYRLQLHYDLFQPGHSHKMNPMFEKSNVVLTPNGSFAMTILKEYFQHKTYVEAGSGFCRYSGGCTPVLETTPSG